MEAFSSQLKSLRKKLGATQRELGEVVGVSYQSISDLERGVTQPSNMLRAHLQHRFGENLDRVETDGGKRIVSGDWTVSKERREEYAWAEVLIKAINLGQRDLVDGILTGLNKAGKGLAEGTLDSRGEKKNSVNFR